jgi:hypothetical protein
MYGQSVYYHLQDRPTQLPTDINVFLRRIHTNI